MSDYIVTARDIDIVTAEIQVIKQEARKTLAMYALAIGERLVEAKSMLPHGEWMTWLAERVEYSQSTANNLMKLYNEYGSNQQSLFDNFANSQTFQNLTTSQALALLAVPADERQEFAEQNHVADLSTRELEKLIRERDEAAAGRKVAESRAEELRKQLEDAGATISSLSNQVQEGTQAMEEAEKEARAEAEAARKRLSDLEEKLRTANQEKETVRQELERARKNPTVSEDQMAKLRKEAEATTKTKYAEQLEKETKKLTEAREKAEQALREAEQKAEAIQKQLETEQSREKLSDPDTAVFNEIFNGIQKDYQRMEDLRHKVAQRDPETAEKLRAAMEKLFTILLEQVKKEEK